MSLSVNIRNIGCFKNLVDSEKLLANLSRAGVNTVFGSECERCDIAILNTCGFTGDAESDSEKAIRELVEWKRSGRCGQIWIMGCLGEKKGQTLKNSIPGIDRVYGNFNWKNILSDLGNEFCESYRTVTTPAHYAYLKISEGCDMPCSYCLKPRLNGPQVSVSMDRLIDEANMLAESGVKELQIVAQNLTTYGTDLYGKKKIADLIEALSAVKGIEWIRLHYGYPNGFPMELLDVMREHDNVCSYLDMAIQHCSTKMLKLMRRGMTKESLTELITNIRNAVPGIYLRTTVMTGHPGETEADFNELYEFVKEMKFERMGVFPYSNQKGTYSDLHYDDNVPEAVKRERAIALMDLQKQIYTELNASLVGQIEKAIVDSVNPDGTVFLRGEHSTPMADPKIIVNDSADLMPGDFHNVKITRSLGKDMEGCIV